LGVVASYVPRMMDGKTGKRTKESSEFGGTAVTRYSYQTVEPSNRNHRTFYDEKKGIIDQLLCIAKQIIACLFLGNSAINTTASRLAALDLQFTSIIILARKGSELYQTRPNV
jgi:hypothetical protein